jgi:hypothetical protein
MSWQGRPLHPYQGASQGCYAKIHAELELTREAFDAKRLVKVLMEALNGFSDVGRVANQSRNVAEPVALPTHSSTMNPCRSVRLFVLQ